MEINVADYGAGPDKTSRENGDALRRALANASAADILRVPCGEYAAPLDLRNVMLRGASIKP